MNHRETPQAPREGAESSPSTWRARMCDRPERTEGTAASQLFCQQIQSCPGLGAYLASSPLQGTGLAPGQHHPPGTLLPVLARPAPADVSCRSPACETLAQSRRTELLRDTGLCLLAQELSQTTLPHLTVSFILTGSMTTLSIQLGTPCSFLLQPGHPTLFWGLATRDTLLSQVWQRTLGQGVAGS